MKIISSLLLCVALLFNSGCSTYKFVQKTRPAAVQTKAQSLGVLQIRASGDSEGQSLMAGVDLTKVNASLLEILAEDPKGAAGAITWDAIKVGGVAMAGKWLNDKYNLTGRGGSKHESNKTINASDGGNIEVNGAPADSYKDHDLQASGPDSSIKLNYKGSEVDNDDNAEFNFDGSLNQDNNR